MINIVDIVIYATEFCTVLFFNWKPIITNNAFIDNTIYFKGISVYMTDDGVATYLITRSLD